MKTSSSALLIVALALFLAGRVSAQMGVVVGITGNHLVKVNMESGELTPLVEISNLPPATELRNLVYIPRDTAFYTTLHTATGCELVRLRTTGAWKKLGPLTVGGQAAFFSKGLTYDEATDRLIAGALLVVNRQDATCRVLATIRANPAPNDFDEIAVFNGQLFCLDATPGRDNTYVFPFALRDLKGELFAGTKQNIGYYTMDDVVLLSHLLYFTDTKTQHLYYFDLMARKLQTVAPITGPAELGTIKLTGLAYLPLSQA
jgi:hypothetical protein